ncbi:MAG: hypothetical protein WCF77_03125 [Minisyncoccia bacterium]|jgi:hypothetical protein
MQLQEGLSVIDGLIENTPPARRKQSVNLTIRDRARLSTFVIPAQEEGREPVKPAVAPAHQQKKRHQARGHQSKPMRSFCGCRR